MPASRKWKQVYTSISLLISNSQKLKLLTNCADTSNQNTNVSVWFSDPPDFDSVLAGFTNDQNATAAFVSSVLRLKPSNGPDVMKSSSSGSLSDVLIAVVVVAISVFVVVVVSLVGFGIYRHKQKYAMCSDYLDSL